MIRIVLLLTVSISIFSQALDPEDVYLEAREDGFYLFIRQKPGINSVMLTESMERPDRSVATYALRSEGPNSVNGSERRLLNGEFLKEGHLSLIDSTPEPNLRFSNPAFLILLTPRILFGYPQIQGSRHGVHDLRELIREGRDPYWFNIRTFEKTYGDYTGKWLDNPFEIKAIHAAQDSAPLPANPSGEISEDRFRPNLINRFTELSRRTYTSEGGDDLIRRIRDILSTFSGDSLDVVICLDTTRSMRPHLQTIKDQLLVPIQEDARRFREFRVGWVFYRDYMEEYLTRTIDFRFDWSLVQRDLNAVQVGGGGDVPEAVIEALYAGANSFTWKSDQRLIILVGDSPPHEVPRGRVTREMLQQAQVSKSIEIHAIMLPYR